MLFAQTSVPTPTDWAWIALLDVGLILLGFAVFVLLLSFRYARRCRELSHSERMKAIESGQPIDEPDGPRAKFAHNAFWISFWLVALVPSAAFSAATSATRGEALSGPLAITIWFFAGASSIAAVLGAVNLMLASRAEQRVRDYGWEKPHLEKDVYA